jgi:hypothetical protein
MFCCGLAAPPGGRALLPCEIQAINDIPNAPEERKAISKLNQFSSRRAVDVWFQTQKTVRCGHASNLSTITRNTMNYFSEYLPQPGKFWIKSRPSGLPPVALLGLLLCWDVAAWYGLSRHLGTSRV